jgi:hypothetical protein
MICNLASQKNVVEPTNVITYFPGEWATTLQIVGSYANHGQHTGDNQSQVIMDVVKEYKIASKVGYFIMDNAENNETMIRALSSCKLLLL